MTDWKVLSHAYGEASEIPALIAQLSPETTDPKNLLWVELWNRLCHQGTVYSASYAALPLLLAYAQALPPEKRTMPLVLMGAIVASDDLHGVERRPLDIIDEISPSAQHLAEECLRAGGHDTIAFTYLLQAESIFDGDQFWGERLDRLVAGEFDGRCPSCSHELHLVIGQHGFFVTAEEWVGPTSRDPERVPIKPVEAAALSGRAAWLHQTAVQHDQSDFAVWIRHLFGTTTCPDCAHPFEVARAVD